MGKVTWKTFQVDVAEGVASKLEEEGRGSRVKVGRTCEERVMAEERAGAEGGRCGRGGP